ncbi:MAG TPA: glycosyltransferase [Bryobacteraceae bacterium]|nr:glycosyltransferase [Bryobacteraceae bacterium]
MPQQTPLPEEPSGPRVSAVLVGYNQASPLRRAIQALQASRDSEHLEILVVDCGSRDETSSLDAEYPAIKALRLPHHFGAAKAMNIATRTAKADLVFLLSPSVTVQPDTVSRLAALLEEDSNAAAVCPLLVDPTGQPVSRVFPLPTPSNVDPAPVSLDLAQDSIAVEYPGRDAILVRKQFIRGINYFDERFGQHWADADLAMQIRRAGKKIRLYPAIRATLHPDPDPLQHETLSEADRALGASAFFGKYYGFFSGLSFRLVAILKALGRFNFRLLGYLVTGQKLDGTQSG